MIHNFFRIAIRNIAGHKGFTFINVTGPANFIVFALIAVGAMIIAMLTVSYQAYKAAGINPAATLKVE